MFEIPKDWKRKKIGDWGEVNAGRQRSPHFTNGERYPYLRVANVFEGHIDHSDILTMRFTEKEYKRYQLEYGDILLNEGQSLSLVGRPAMYVGVPEKCCFQNTLVRFRPGNEADAEFALALFRYLYHSGTFVKIAVQTTSIAHLGVSRFADIAVTIPPLAEQRKIAEILGTWDEAIATTEKLIAALQRRKQGLMQRLLTGQVRFPEFSKEKWRRVPLGEFLQSISRNEAVQADKEYRLIGVRLYLQGAHIHTVLPGEAIVTKSLSCIREGDVLYNKMWVSKNAFAVAKPEHDGAYGSGEYPQFRAKKGLDIGFLEQAFHNPRFLHDATSLCRGTTGRIRLHPDDFLELTMLLPSEEEQVKIATVLRMNDEEMTKAMAYLENLREQKKGLMQRLRTGQVWVAGVGLTTDLPGSSEASGKV